MSDRPRIICPICGSDETLRVDLTLAGTPASFTLCAACRWNAWDRVRRRRSSSLLVPAAGR